MKKTILLFILLLSITSLNAQTTKSIMAEVNPDSLLLSLEELTGEKPTASVGTITNRKSVNGKTSTYLYLEDKLANYGLETEIVNYRSTGNNVIAIQKGVKYPDSAFIICAHYDSVDDYCADDNASGTSAVLEAARLLSQYRFNYTIIYALWDEEEKGLIGSYNYAKRAKENGDKIAGVLNMDMIGYDGNEDYLFEVHIGNSPINARLTNKLTQVLDNSGLIINKSIQIPGTDRSDHNSFWNLEYPAIFITEGFFNEDFNPTYHTSDDRISFMSLDYHYQISQLVIATLFELAEIDTTTSVDDDIDIVFEIYPNPTTDFINFNKKFNGVEITDIKVYSLTGRELLSYEPTNNINKIDIADLQTGVYFLTINTVNKKYTKSFVKI